MFILDARDVFDTAGCRFHCADSQDTALSSTFYLPVLTTASLPCLYSAYGVSSSQNYRSTTSLSIDHKYLRTAATHLIGCLLYGALLDSTSYYSILAEVVYTVDVTPTNLMICLFRAGLFDFFYILSVYNFVAIVQGLSGDTLLLRTGEKN